MAVSKNLIVRVGADLSGLRAGFRDAGRTTRQFATDTGQAMESAASSMGRMRTATEGKTVYDVYFDEKMNDTFVKYSGGKRYYYPASQEYGFRTRGGGRKGGLYFMRNTAVSYYGALEARVAQAVDQILEDIK